jgi:hypothetical protein
MAHFAKLNENNIVLEVHVVNNDALDTSNEEASGIAFLTEWSGGHSNWKQTSYNSNIRRRYASVGMSYDPVADVFIEQQPFASWSLDENYDWQPPTPMPVDNKFYAWDEETLSWLEITE